MTDSELWSWLEEWHTLHWSVEALYVVDGYEVSLTRDDETIHGPFHQETFREAYEATACACRQAGWLPY